MEKIAAGFAIHARIEDCFISFSCCDCGDMEIEIEREREILRKRETESNKVAMRE